MRENRVGDHKLGRLLRCRLPDSSDETCRAGKDCKTEKYIHRSDELLGR